MPQDMPFGQWVKLRRTALDLTQWELAERIGCSRETIQKIETGVRRPSKQIAQLLADSLKSEPEERDVLVRWARHPSDPMPASLAASLSSPISPCAEPVDPGEPSAPINLPAPLTSLVGRDDEVDAIRHYMLREDIRLLTLIGPPGIGKTRIGIAAAACCATRFPDGVYFVPLEAVNDANLVIAAVAKSLGMRHAGNLPVAEALARHLHDKRALLVLDNFEQVLDAGPQILQLLSGCPHLRLLVTSRESLHIYGEWRFHIPPLELPVRKRLQDRENLARVDSVVLFAERAQALKPDFALSPDNIETIAAICIRLDGLPLAIELAAARIGSLAPEQILAGLGNRLELLKGVVRYLPARQQTLRASIDWSYDLLSPAERLLLGRLAVFIGGWTRAAAEAVCADSQLPEEQILDLLGQLVDRSLVVAEGGRYRFLETIRDYAFEQLAKASEAETLRLRHAAFFAGYLEERLDLILGREQDRVIQEIDAEIGNVRAAWDWALAAGRHDLVRRASLSLLWYYELQSGFSEGEAACARAVAALTDDSRLDPVLLAVLRSYHGYFLGRLGRLRYAREELEQGCAVLRQADARSELAGPLIMLGTIVWQEGDYIHARCLLEESLRLSRITDANFWISLALFFLGQVAHSSGDYAQADGYFREALHLSREGGQPRMISMISVLSGQTLFALSSYSKARERLEEGLALARASRIQWLVGVAQGRLGLVLNAQEDHAGARMALREAVALAQESDNQWDRAWGEVGLGDAELGLRNSVEASSHYRLGLQLAMEAHALPIALDALAGLALLRAQAGDREQALELAGHVSLHPASSGNARTRSDQVRRMLKGDSDGQPIWVGGIFEETVQRVLAGGS